jgi:hypothetical protein
MKLIGSGGQGRNDYGFRADGTIASGGTPQLLLPATSTRSFLVVQNLSSGSLWIDFGGPRAHATLTSGVVTSVTVDNAGFGYTLPPVVRFIGGLAGVSSTAAHAGFDTAQPAPTNAYGGGRPAQAVAVLVGGAVSSITVTDGGTGYTNVPYVFLHNRREDPFGCADPSVSSGSGILLGANGGSYYVNGTVCPTDPVAIYGATTSQAFTCMWLP